MAQGNVTVAFAVFGAVVARRPAFAAGCDAAGAGRARIRRRRRSRSTAAP